MFLFQPPSNFKHRVLEFFFEQVVWNRSFESSNSWNIFFYIELYTDMYMSLINLWLVVFIFFYWQILLLFLPAARVLLLFIKNFSFCCFLLFENFIHGSFRFELNLNEIKVEQQKKWQRKNKIWYTTDMAIHKIINEIFCSFIMKVFRFFHFKMLLWM